MEFDIQCLYEILETRFDISEKELQEADSFSDYVHNARVRRSIKC